jgi:MFS family permease
VYVRRNLAPPDGVPRRGRQHCGRTEPNPPPTSRPSFALSVLVTGVLITAIDATIVILALPEIQRAIHIRLTSVIWVIIGYVLVITLMLTQVGRLGDMFGRVGMYEAGFMVFIVGSWSVYDVGTAQTGGSTLYTIKWTGLEPTEAGWRPPSDIGVSLGKMADPQGLTGSLNTGGL